MSEALLSVDSLRVSIGDRAILRGISLQVGRGEILGLVGASGSGKSLTALAILRLLPSAARMSGHVRLHGADLSGLTEREMQRLRGRKIGIVFQEPMTSLNPLLQVGRQVAEAVRLHRAGSTAQARQRAWDALAAVGLGDVPGILARYPHQLSGGQRQRVAIAAAMVLRPALLIADEPTTALDVITQAQVLALLRDLVRKSGMALVLVSHDMAVMAAVADRVAIVHGGEIVEQGRSGDALRDLRHPYARALLAAAALPPKGGPSPPASGAPLLEVRGLVRIHSRRRTSWHADAAVRAVDGVSLCIHPGENVGLVGESGSGKSSLLRAILALDPPQSGEVRLLGEGFSAAGGAVLRRLRRSIQAVFQDPYGSFDPQWRVERLIAEPFHLLDEPLSAGERRRRVHAVLEEVGLSPADGGRYCHEFSGGQRQRIAIARALVTRPAVIAFDEAVSALDVLVRGQILALLAELSARLKLSMLFVTHDLNVVRAVSDRIYVMREGRIVEEGPTEQVFESPREAYTAALIAARFAMP